MEIHDLKSIWTKVVDSEHTKYQVDQDKVQQLIHKKSNTTIDMIKRKLIRKQWLLGIIGSVTVLLAPVFYYDTDSSYFLDSILSKFEMSLIYFLMGVIIIIAFINAHRCYRKIVDYQKMSDNLKTTLEQTINILNKIMKHGVYSDAIGIPIFGTWILYRSLFKEASFAFDHRILLLILFAIGLFILKKYIGTYLQNKKFRPFINTLEKCISDIEYIEKDT